jgi:hypothetical protein
VTARDAAVNGETYVTARDAAVNGETYVPALGTCVYCGEQVQPVIVWVSGDVDWERDGDSGCPESPDTEDEGTGGHYCGPWGAL